MSTINNKIRNLQRKYNLLEKRVLKIQHIVQATNNRSVSTPTKGRFNVVHNNTPTTPVRKGRFTIGQNSAIIRLQRT